MRWWWKWGISATMCGYRPLQRRGCRGLAARLRFIPIRWCVRTHLHCMGFWLRMIWRFSRNWSRSMELGRKADWPSFPLWMRTLCGLRSWQGMRNPLPKHPAWGIRRRSVWSWTCGIRFRWKIRCWDWANRLLWQVQPAAVRTMWWREKP